MIIHQENNITKMLKYISIPIFLVSFALGILFVYSIGSDLKTVYVYPTPENVNEVLFRDNADNCFAFQQREVGCPTDETKIAKVPVQ